MLLLDSVQVVIVGFRSKLTLASQIIHDLFEIICKTPTYQLSLTCSQGLLEEKDISLKHDDFPERFKMISCHKNYNNLQKHFGFWTPCHKETVASHASRISTQFGHVPEML